MRDENKVPWQSFSHTKASPTDPSTWADFADVNYAWKSGNRAGIGYVLTADDGFVVLDLDKVRDPETGAVVDWAQKLLDKFDTLTYISISGCGFHIWMRSNKPIPSGIKVEMTKAPHTGLEMYDRERYFAMSGNIFRKAKIKDYTDDILGLYKWMRKKQQEQSRYEQRVKDTKTRRVLRNTKQPCHGKRSQQDPWQPEWNEALFSTLLGDPIRTKGYEVLYQCPLREHEHDATKPAFWVNADTQFRCFKCDVGGSAWKLAKLLRGEEKAKKLLADIKEKLK